MTTSTAMMIICVVMLLFSMTCFSFLCVRNPWWGTQIPFRRRKSESFGCRCPATEDSLNFHEVDARAPGPLPACSLCHQSDPRGPSADCSASGKQRASSRRMACFEMRPSELPISVEQNAT